MKTSEAFYNEFGSLANSRRATQLLTEFAQHRHELKEYPLEFELNFVAFDRKGVPHPLNELSSKKTKDRRLLPVLVRCKGGAIVAWYGPVWFADPDKNGKKRYLTSIDLTRIHWWARPKHYEAPTIGLDRDDAGFSDHMLYVTPGDKTVRVPEYTDEFGSVISLYDVPFW